MSDSCAAIVYAEQLVSRGYGLPLWHPEPTRFGEVEIGDVGFVSEGSFIRLFNAMRPEGDPINEDGVPAGFVVLQPNERLLHSAQHHVSAGPICTTTTTYRKVNAEASTSSGLAGSGAAYTFSCHSSRGAIAVLGDAGHQTWYIRNRHFREYIAAHHASWYDFAVERGYDVPSDAIVLVSGWLKTSEWAIATFSNQGKAQDISFNASAGSYARAAFEVSVGTEVSMSVEQRCGPPPNENAMPHDGVALPHNQCLFLRYYKVKTRRALGRPKISMQAEAKDVLGPWQSGSSSATQRSRSSGSNSPSSVESRPSWFSRILGAAQQLRRRHSVNSSAESQKSTASVESTSTQIEEMPPACIAHNYNDPVDVILDHILETSPAPIAIACHDDAYDLFSHKDWPDDLSQHLTRACPTLDFGFDAGTCTFGCLKAYDEEPIVNNRPLTQDSGYASLHVCDREPGIGCIRS